MPQFVTTMNITYTIYNEEGNEVYTDYDQTRLQDADSWELAIFFSKQYYIVNSPQDCIDITFDGESAQLVNN